MSKKLPNDELSWEDTVSRYLEANPDYFQRHLDVLAALRLPHPESGAAISLIERQIKTLRDRNTTLQQQLRDLVGLARENDAVNDRLHRFAIAMIDAGSLDDVLDTARDHLRQEFRVDSVNIYLSGNNDEARGRPEFVSVTDNAFPALLKQFAAKKPVCSGKYDPDTMRYLFKEQAPEIKSTAVISLKDARRDGLLCLGSREPHRFHPDMGTVYLARLGELLMRGVARY